MKYPFIVVKDSSRKQHRHENAVPMIKQPAETLDSSPVTSVNAVAEPAHTVHEVVRQHSSEEKGLSELIFKKGQDLLSTEFMELNGIQPDNSVAVIEGSEFNPQQFGFRDHIPNSTKFRFYFVKKDNNLKNQYRLFECLHDAENGNKKCDQVIQGMSKFFTHLRTHT